MDKEGLRKLFGRRGDVNQNLEQMFGKAYLDSPDKSRENLPPELQDLNVHNVGDLVERAVESAPIINCQANQSLIIRFLKEYIGGKDTSVSHEEWWQVVKHMDTCYGESCHELYEMACLDKYLTPEALMETYGEKIKGWKIK